jgi:hypothetical protein
MNFTKEELHTSLSYLASLFERDDVKVRGFDMDVCAKRYDNGTTLSHSPDTQGREREVCGTVACIGGWIWLLNKEQPTDNGEYTKDAHERATDFVSSFHPTEHEDLYDLFYPKNVTHWSSISPKEAAKAIRNYITVGNPNWDEVVDPENTCCDF